MTPNELNDAIRNNRLPSLVYLYGAERYFVDRSVQLITDHVVPVEARDFNLQLFTARDNSVDEILDSVRTLPVFTDLRLVIVRDADKLNAADLEALTGYVSEPVPETKLVFVGEKVDKRKKFFQQFQKTGALVEFKGLYENQIPAFVRDQAKAAGYQFTEDAMALFCRRSGTSLQEVVGELEKLFHYIGDRSLVDADDVKAVVSDTRVDSIFDLTNAIGARNTAEALRLLGRLLNDGTAPLLALNMLTRHFRQLWMTRELLDEGQGRKDISRRIGVNPYFIDGLIKQARYFEARHFRFVFEKLLAADLALKSTGNKPDVVLEQLLLEIAGNA